MRNMAKFFNTENKYSIIILSIVCAFLLIVVLAIVFSNVKFETRVEGTVATIINDGDLVINYVDGDNIEINDNKEHAYSLSITNSSDSKIYYSIYFTEANGEALAKINDYEGNLVNEENGDLLSNKLINLYSIEGGETLRYSLVIKAKNKFKGTLKIVNESLTTDTFSDLILLNNNVAVPKTRVGVEVATNDEGLIKGEDNKGVSYYFRGNVSNNYVKLGNLLFRIVRINGDSTVRLVFDNVLDEQYAYNTNTLGQDQTPSSLALLSSASILTVLDSWVNDNLGEFSEYLSVGDYCTDTNFNTEINGLFYSASYRRNLVDKEPSLFCTADVYSGRVGLLSADEVVFAGASSNIPNSNYYLYNKDIDGNYITNSSYSINSSNGISMMNVMSNGAFSDGILIDKPSYIRPVINISINARVKGTGIINDPYIIVS